jgi:hypothetical protein
MAVTVVNPEPEITELPPFPPLVLQPAAPPPPTNTVYVVPTATALVPVKNPPPPPPPVPEPPPPATAKYLRARLTVQVKLRVAAVPPRLDTADTVNDTAEPVCVGVPVICPVVSPRLRPVGNAPALTVYCTVPAVAVADNVTVLIAVPVLNVPILLPSAGLTQEVVGALTVQVNALVTALPPRLETALTVKLCAEPVDEGVPVI